MSRGAGRGGFTLVEIIFATGLLALVMIMMFNLLPTSLITIREAEHHLTAESRAQHVLDYYRSLPFTTLVGFAGTTSDVYLRNQPASKNFYPEEPPADDGMPYHADVDISKANALTNPPHLLTLTATVYYPQRVDNSSGNYTTWHGKCQEEVDVVEFVAGGSGPGPTASPQQFP